jgi:hypothetical protein
LRFLAEDALESGDPNAFQAELYNQRVALLGVEQALAGRGKRGAGRPQRIGLR